MVSAPGKDRTQNKDVGEQGADGIFVISPFKQMPIQYI
jgi:hypothetical protein